MYPFTPSSTRRSLFAATLTTAALALLGCSSINTPTPEQIVTQRVEQRWAALIDEDFRTAWTYTQPGFRAAVKQKDYARRFGGVGSWQGIQVHQVTCEAERCKVSIRLTTRVSLPKFPERDIVGYIDEVWVREDGEWWFYQKL